MLSVGVRALPEAYIGALQEEEVSQQANIAEELARDPDGAKRGVEVRDWRRDEIEVSADRRHRAGIVQLTVRFN
jgi:hypothetical protein